MTAPEKRSTLKLIFGMVPAYVNTGNKFVEISDIFACSRNNNDKFYAISHDATNRFTSSRFWKNITTRFWQFDEFNFNGAAAASFLGNAHRFKIWFNPYEVYKLLMIAAMDLSVKFKEQIDSKSKNVNNNAEQVSLPTEKDIEQEKIEAEKQWEALINGTHPNTKNLAYNYGWDRNFYTELLKSKEQNGWTDLGWKMWSNLIINYNYINKNVTSIMIHEEQHILWNHLIRSGNRDKYQMNIAQDYAINQQLEWTPEMQKILITKFNETFYHRFVISYVRFILMNEPDKRDMCKDKFGLQLNMVEGGNREENIRAFIQQALPQIDELRKEYILDGKNHYLNRPDKTDGKSADFYYRILQETMIFHSENECAKDQGNGGSGGVRGYDNHDQWDNVASDGEETSGEDGDGNGKNDDVEGKDCKGKAEGGKIDQTREYPHAKKNKPESAGSDIKNKDTPLSGSRSKIRCKSFGAGFEHAGFDVTTACSRQEVKSVVRDAMERSGINPDDPADIEHALKRIPGLNGALGVVISDWFKVRTKNWRHILSKYVTTAINVKDMDYTMSRENRRLPGVFPGKRRERGIDLIVAIDTSGSINYNDYNDFVNQIEKISNDCEINKVRLIQCHHSISFDAVVNLRQIKKLGIVETGGTTMRCVFEKLKRENNKKLLILFTDGCIDDFDPKAYSNFKHIMFVSRGNKIYGENLQNKGFTVISQDEE